MRDNILVIGSSGQIGTELVIELRKIYGNDHVVASDIIPSSEEIMSSGPYEKLDVTDADKLLAVVKKHHITQVYLLAAMLSAKAEKNIDFAWKLNMDSLFNILNLAKEKIIKKIFWPSSIAVFGPNTKKELTPQCALTEPNTVYGISKLTGERWCEYYFNKFNVDVVSIRYPGLIGWKSEPGGGTTDYAVHIFHEALKNNTYTCFLSEKTTLPMMYMNDAIRATIEIMQTKAENVKIRSSYNIAGCSFNPMQIAAQIKSKQVEFTINYKVDFRQEIANSWPQSIDDSEAMKDWKWKAQCNLEKITHDMLDNLRIKYNISK
ncbi:MAG: NAD-dependent epimerase/dehydratase family protein [Flavobacteriales bacterium]|nr:NAD-dependent epimerase/dehydratase family protein [Flavobacteriales bacterium]